MEFQDNNTKIQKPSKAFLKRGGIATGIIALLLVVQTPWFQGIFSKKDKKNSLVAQDATIGDVVSKDSNNNGIPDWQERLWGLDPTVATTNGVSNKTIIEEKRKSLQGQVLGEENLNETDIVAQQLYGVTSALGQSGLNSSSLASIGADLGESIELKQPVNKYSVSDIKTTKTTFSSLKNYFNTVSSIVSKYDDDTEEISLIISALETEDFSNLSKLTQKSIDYKSLSKQLKDIKVPVGVSDYHLNIINGLYGIAESFDYIAELEDNGINALSGINSYKNYSLLIEQTLISMNDYFLNYGIIKE